MLWGHNAPTQPPLAAEHYLQQLPVAVIRNGQVVNVRADIEALLKAPPTPPSCSHVVTTSDDAAPADGEAQAAEGTTLRVKGEDGAHTYVIKLAADATIGHLRRHLDRHRCVPQPTSPRPHGWPFSSTRWMKRTSRAEGEPLACARRIPNRT